MITRRLAVAALASTALCGLTSVEGWPDRPLTMVVPFAAGGPTDVLGRILADRMSQALGQQVTVENVTGTGGMTGAQRIAQARPDGYQFVLGTVGTHAVNQTLYKRPLYNAATDFMPVALVAEVPLVLITRKDLPPKNLREFMAHVKQNATEMNYGSAGNGSAVHLGCLLLNAALGTEVQHVPYRGSAPALTDLQSGRLDFMCDIITTAAPLVNGGSVKGLATLGKARSPALPNLPTADEQGLKGFEAYTWNAIFLPKGTPEPIARKLRDAVLEAMNDPAVRSRLRDLGAVLVAPERTTPEYLAEFVRSEIRKWEKPIKASGISVD